MISKSRTAVFLALGSALAISATETLAQTGVTQYGTDALANNTTGGVWTNASSRDLKDDIETLSEADANTALEALSPVRYVYKNSRDEEYVGFIAEDVPDLVATNDHKSLSPMDIVAVLTTVTKHQKLQLAEKDTEIAELQDRMVRMEMALAEVLRNQSSEPVSILSKRTLLTIPTISK